MIVFAIIKEGEILWPEHNSRRKYWVNPSFQIKYCLVLLGVGIGLTVISLVFSYTYLRVSISELVGGNSFLINKFISPYVITFLIISLGFCAILFTV
jgi:signal peptidase II